MPKKCLFSSQFDWKRDTFFGTPCSIFFLFLQNYRLVMDFYCQGNVKRWVGKGEDFAKEVELARGGPFMNGATQSSLIVTRLTWQPQNQLR